MSSKNFGITPRYELFLIMFSLYLVFALTNEKFYKILIEYQIKKSKTYISQLKDWSPYKITRSVLHISN